MALVDLIEDASSSPLLLRDLYAGGDPGPIVAALAQVPELCEVALPFIGAALGPSHVSFRHKEIAILRTSANLSCKYCVDAHTVVAFESGLTNREVLALRECPTAWEVFDDGIEQALVRWIDALTAAGGGTIPTGIANDAQALLGDHRLVELTVTVGVTMLLNRFATGLGLPTSSETVAQLADHGYQPFQHPTPATPVSIGAAS
jgi:AhpD family alkylhydroperoxidase